MVTVCDSIQQLVRELMIPKADCRFVSLYAPQGRPTPLTLRTLQAYERGRKIKREYYDPGKTSEF